jgi:hypothetical protein
MWTQQLIPYIIPVLHLGWADLMWYATRIAEQAF